MKYGWIIAALLLAGCGADGPPVRPTASAGVVLSPGGVSGAASAGVSVGNVTLGVGL